jgi:hypothetical protein
MVATLYLQSQDHNAAGNIKSIEESNDLIRKGTSDFLVCSIVPQPTKLPCAFDDMPVYY